jgi:2-polyprenyl-6-methoxyphenol hydroxylase-like FAD-dependent oxidoreductase
VAIVDRLTAGANTSRAAAVNARTLEVLEDLDVAGRMVKSGLIAPRFTMRQAACTLMPIDFSVLPTKYPYTLMISQPPPRRCSPTGWPNSAVM